MTDRKQTITVDFELAREGDIFIALCPCLDLASQGPTESEATGNLIQTIRLFFQSCRSRNCLDQALSACSFDWSASCGSRHDSAGLIIELDD